MLKSHCLNNMYSGREILNFGLSEERYVNIEQGYFITIPKNLVGEITIQEGSKNTQHLLYTDTDEKWLEVHTLMQRYGKGKIMKHSQTNLHVVCSAKTIKILKAQILY